MTAQVRSLYSALFGILKRGAVKKNYQACKCHMAPWRTPRRANLTFLMWPLVGGVAVVRPIYLYLRFIAPIPRGPDEWHRVAG